METKISDHELDQILAQVKIEFHCASLKFNAFNSGHEGYAVIKEELDELWDEIKGSHNIQLLYDESLQVAAMAIRMIVDICLKSDNPMDLR